MSGSRCWLFLLLLLVWGDARAAAPPLLPENHWAFRRPMRTEVPIIAGEPSRNPIDAFIRARLRQVGLSSAPPADRRVLLRRVTFDLTGLPPTPEQTEAFLNDSRPDAYERLVDRLLASPHYGERWAQHWLDVARFAETNGYELDGERPQAWRYRDWVVAALNADYPYDRFLTDQLAGDLLARSGGNRDELLIAVGFNRCGPIHQVSGNIDPLEVRHELLNEMTGGLGAAFLGLTLSCARCHDHKFDPISQEDYFRLEAFFGLAQPKEVDLATAAQRLQHSRDVAVVQARIAALRTQIATLEAPYRQRLREQKLQMLDPKTREAHAVEAKKRTPEQKKLVAESAAVLKITWDEVVAALNDTDRAIRAKLRQQMHELQARMPLPPAQAWTLQEDEGKPFAYVLRRGNIHRRGKKVEPGYPQVLLRGGESVPANRLDLARWLTHPDHPLTARVIVNRLWQHHFGQGLVRTPNDFGIKGDRPSHPELLDWLARELIDGGWSLKRLHRLMVLSETYRQSSQPHDPRAEQIDPDNRLLSRMNRRRLDAESLRDSILAVTGQLYPRVGGPKVRIPLEPEVYDLIFTEDEPDGLWPVTPDVREHTRRSLYLFNKRNVRQPILEAFDQPDTLSSCAVRPVSTFAPQALILLNGPLTQTQSRVLAVRVWREAGPEPAALLDRVYRLVLCRPPSPQERDQGLAFLASQSDLLRDQLRQRLPVALPEELPQGADPALLGSLSDLCLALFNRNAFVYVD
jgi:hypothetical protein